MTETTATPAEGAKLFADPPQPHRETKEEAFLRIGQPRVERAVVAIRLVSNLANRSQYDPQPEDVDAIVTTLKQAVGDMEARFRSNMPREPFRFRR